MNKNTDLTKIRPVVVGLGHDSHLAGMGSDKTYCGRTFTADSQDPLISCPACRAAYAAGRHPAFR